MDAPMVSNVLLTGVRQNNGYFDMLCYWRHWNSVARVSYENLDADIELNIAQVRERFDDPMMHLVHVGRRFMLRDDSCWET